MYQMYAHFRRGKRPGRTTTTAEPTRLQSNTSAQNYCITRILTRYKTTHPSTSMPHASGAGRGARSLCIRKFNNTVCIWYVSGQRAVRTTAPPLYLQLLYKFAGIHTLHSHHPWAPKALKELQPQSAHLRQLSFVTIFINVNISIHSNCTAHSRASSYQMQFEPGTGTSQEPRMKARAGQQETQIAHHPW